MYVQSLEVPFTETNFSMGNQRTNYWTGQIDREGNARKVVNCSCVVVKDWGEESQERSILLNYFQTEQ